MKILLALLLIVQEPLVQKTGPLAKALLLMRDGKTSEARVEMERERAAHPQDAEVGFQIARSFLLDFYRETDPTKRRLALAQAMENLAAALARNPDHIPALRAKAMLHARAELLYYDPNLSYQLASRAAKLEPHNNGFMLNLSEWMSGEVRFTQESGHRVPHDPLLGLDRSIDLLDRVIDEAIPYSPEETAALFLMGNTLARRGNFDEAIRYYERELTRPINTEQKVAVLRELGASLYRTANYEDAGRRFYEALQWRPNSIDQWLLRVTLDQIKNPPPLPKNVLFEVDEAKTSANLAFEDMAVELGVNRKNGNGTVAFGDIDGDGALDIIVAGSGTFLTAYRQINHKFVDSTAAFGLANVPSGYSLNLVDYDNDGRLDLYISYNGWNGPMLNRLFHNEGGRFVDVTKKSGLDNNGSGFVSLWADLDNDGWPDVVIANGVLKDGSVPQIYRNNKNGTFTNVTKVAGLNEPPAWGAIGLALGDYDKDGRVDIFINGLGDGPNRLYHNDGNWKFTESAAKAGVAQPPHNGFVAFFCDYNNDGLPDLLTTSLAPWEVVVEGLKAGYKPRGLHPDATRLFKNNGNGTFTDVTLAAGLGAPMGTMGAGVADLDNDGYLDIYFGTGDPQLTRLEPNRFFHNNGNGTFTDLTRAVGFARPGNKGHGVAFADIDNDGDLDVFAQLGGHYPGDHAVNAFYRNLKGNENNWLEVDLQPITIGAQITVRAGGLIVYREVKGSEGFGATSPYRQHFGLGKHSTVDSLEVVWPSGKTTTRNSLPVNMIVSVKQP